MGTTYERTVAEASFAAVVVSVGLFEQTFTARRLSCYHYVIIDTVGNGQDYVDGWPGSNRPRMDYFPRSGHIRVLLTGLSSTISMEDA